MNFIERLRAGEIPDDQVQNAIDDEIGAWDNEGHGLSLHEYLGMTFEEFARWVRNPMEIDKIKSPQSRPRRPRRTPRMPT